ncbi:transposase [Ochrobactrum sp. WV_118_8]|nr:transposase [Hyphomicrobiales bacterium]
MISAGKRWRLYRADASSVMPIDYCLDPHQPVKATPPCRTQAARRSRFASTRWASPCRFFNYSTVEIGNSATEQAIRPIAFGSKDRLFAEADKGVALVAHRNREAQRLLP